MRHRRTPKVPKPPKQQAPDRPRVRDLRHLYKGLMQVKAGNRVATLQTALHWFDDAVKYTIFKQQGQLTLEQAQAYEKGNKMREVKGRPTEERELFFKKAIVFYEKMLKGTSLEPPEIGEYYTDLERVQPKLEIRQEKLEERFDKMLTTLKAAMQPKDDKGRDIELRVDHLKGVNDNYQMDPDISVLTFNRSYAKVIKRKMYREGLLPAALEVMEPLARMSALEAETDGLGSLTGRLVLSKGKQLIACNKMLQNLVEFAKTDAAPRRLVKVPTESVPGSSVAPRPKRQGVAPKRGPKIAGLFVAGTDGAFVYTTLTDGQWHSKQEMQKHITAKIEGRIRKMLKVGKRKGLWKIEENGDQVRMVALQPPTSANPTSQGVTI